MKKSKVTLEITVDTSEAEAVYNDIYEFMRVCRLQDFSVNIVGIPDPKREHVCGATDFVYAAEEFGAVCPACESYKPYKPYRHT